MKERRDEHKDAQRRHGDAHVEVALVGRQVQELRMMSADRCIHLKVETAETGGNTAALKRTLMIEATSFGTRNSARLATISARMAISEITHTRAEA